MECALHGSQLLQALQRIFFVFVSFLVAASDLPLAKKNGQNLVSQ